MKTINPKMLLMLFALLFVAACDDDVDDDDITDPMPEETAAVYNDEAVRAEIESMENAYADASNARDVDAVLMYYSDDAESYAPNEKALVGKEAIRERIKSEMASDTMNNKIAFTVKDVWSCGDIAVETGAYAATDSAGNTVSTGKYMSLFQKRDGKYVAIRDIYNSDMPRDDN